MFCHYLFDPHISVLAIFLICLAIKSYYRVLYMIKARITVYNPIIVGFKIDSAAEPYLPPSMVHLAERHIYLQ